MVIMVSFIAKNMRSFLAKNTKNMPKEFLDDKKPYVTNDFFEYAMPLTGGIEPKTQIFV